MCMTEVPTLGAVELGDRLGPSASLGSWCNLGQTHERPHVDGSGTKKAKLCIYLKALQADSRSKTSLAGTWVAPNGESKSMAKTVLAVPNATAGGAVRLMELLAAAECAFRSSSV